MNFSERWNLDAMTSTPQMEDVYGPPISNDEKSELDLQNAARRSAPSRFELGVAEDLGNRAYERALREGHDAYDAYYFTVNGYLDGTIACECNGDGSCRVCRAAARQLHDAQVDGDELAF